MKNQTQKTATASPQTRRTPQQNSKPNQAARVRKSLGLREAEAVNVTLDPEASALVLWACRAFGRRPADVVSGAIMDTFPQAREEYERGDFTNMIEGLQDRFAAAGTRRIEREDAEAENAARLARLNSQPASK